MCKKHRGGNSLNLMTETSGEEGKERKDVKSCKLLFHERHFYSVTTVHLSPPAAKPIYSQDLFKIQVSLTFFSSYKLQQCAHRIKPAPSFSVRSLM